MGDKIDSLIQGVVGWKNPSQQWQSVKDGAASLARDSNGGAALAGKSLSNRTKQIDDEVDRQAGGVEAAGGSTLKSTIRQERDAAGSN